MGLMNNSNNVPTPGLARQGSVRTAFRVAAVVFGVALLVCLVMAVKGMISEFGDESVDAGFPSFFLWWGGVVVLLALTGFSAQAGFGGLALRYAAGETAPVVRDSASYLTDGEGLLGIGRTVDDAPRATGAAAAGEKTGPYCRGCGTRNDDTAKFCDHCGASFA